MGAYAEIEAMRSYGYGSFKTEIHEFGKVTCPVCEKECGGKSGFFGEQGRLEGVHQHMKVVHGIKQRWRREGLLASKDPTP